MQQPQKFSLSLPKKVVLSKGQADGVLLLVAIIWGSSYSFIKQATLAQMTPGMINLFRGLILAGLIALFFFQTIKTMTRQELKAGLIIGINSFILMQSQTLGIKSTKPSNAAFLTALYVVFVPFLAWIFFHEKPAPKVYWAIVLCILGMIFLTGIFRTGFILQAGDLWVLLTALMMGLEIIYYRIFNFQIRALPIAFLTGVVQIIGGLLFVGLLEKPSWNQVAWSQALLPLIILGIVTSFISQILQIIGQRYTDVTSTGLILMTESLFASLTSLVLGLEKLTADLVIGGSLILAALLLMQVSPQSLKRFLHQKT
ncbi:DMT family transporter [Lactobacillus sp. DCY120]|uniref:DMT family transporter n=1 Tax=Bombilactobacillus apium TaxID=2675299 RepID=A0A850R5F9_9LACO|nr:DMT family transporter [Bombilactobacillus apium]NVY96087.1 DMT family transporter [Bombilactobacillus apium]